MELQEALRDVIGRLRGCGRSARKSHGVFAWQDTPGLPPICLEGE